MKSPIRFAFTALLLSFSAAAFSQDAAPAAIVEAPPVTETAQVVEAVVEAVPEVVAEPAITEAPLDRSSLKYSNKWRVKFDNEAKADGTLVFRMVMKDTSVEPITVSVAISKGTNENNTADKVKNALQKAFPRDFNVETDDGESVLVKLNVIEGSSSLELLSNDVKKLKVKIKKE